MAEAIGTAVIEVVADGRKLRAGIEDAKKSLRTLGEGQKDISKGASQSIDRYIGSLKLQNATIGKSVRETELLKLAMRGASNEQINAADAALKTARNFEILAASRRAASAAFVAFGAIAVTSLVAAGAAFDTFVKKAGDFQDMSEKMGDSAENIASLAVAAAVGGLSMEDLSAASVKLTKNLVEVDDESEAAGAAIKALGLNIEEFKALSPVARIEALAKALAGFEDGANKTAVAVAILGKSGANALPFLKELAEGVGRQNILTSEQIRLADEYSDQQKRIQAQISLYASVIATEMLPAYNELAAATLEVIKQMVGIEAGATQLKNSDAIKKFADDAVKALLFIVNAADGVVRAFEIVVIRLKALATTAIALKNLDLVGAFKSEVQSAKDINEALLRPLMGSRIQSEIDKRRALPADQEDLIGVGRQKGQLPAPRKTKKAGGTGGDVADQQRQEAKAQLALDLEQIKKASEAQINTFDNAQRLMEAMRSADLVSDKDYYASKLGFIKLFAQEREAELQKEIARLQQETFTGKNAAKEQLDNDRKVLELQAQIAKTRADAVTNIQINSIQEVAANKKIEQSYKDATEAANEYIDSIKKRNQLELAGVGRGDRARAELAGMAAIEEKRSAELQRIARDKRNNPNIDPRVFDDYLRKAEETYSREVALYQEHSAELRAAQADGLNGMSRALDNYIDETRNVAKQTEELWTNAFQGLEDALVDFTKTGKFNFKSLADSIVADLTRMTIKQNITGPLAEMMKGSGGGGLFGGLFGGATAVAGSLQSGINYVPQTGIYQLHEGERVVSKSENKGGAGNSVVIYQSFAPGTDTRTVNQAAAATGMQFRRAMARNT